MPPKREAMPPGSMHKLALVAQEYTDPQSFKALFEKTTREETLVLAAARIPLYVGHFRAIRDEAEKNRATHPNYWICTRGSDIARFDPKLVHIVLCRGWRDSIGGYLARAELEARGFEVKMVAL